MGNFAKKALMSQAAAGPDYGKELFRLLVETVDEYAIFAMDPEGRIVHWNAGAARITGFEEAEVLGRPLLIIFTPEDLKAGVPWEELEKAARTGRAEDERWQVRKDGSRFWATGTVVPVRAEDGALLGFGKILRDRTDLKEQEQALRSRARDLAVADDRKNVFLATLAHELRNLLAPLANSGQVLQMQGAQNPGLQRVADIIDRQVRQMKRLVEDLMDVSRISRGSLQLQRQRIRLSDIVSQAVEVVRPLIESRRHSLEVALPSAPLELDADPDRVRQVIVNLLNNAAKYTDPGGDIVVTVDREGDEAVLRVRDTGIGMQPEQMATIFDLFTQAHPSLHQSQSGLGLGLALVRDLVSLHGGTVQVRSAGVGKGSEFIVHLPIPGESGAPWPFARLEPQADAGES
jgi:PAS domain S-box-containing protein